MECNNICLVFRGELLRNTQAVMWPGNGNLYRKNLLQPDLSEESFVRQDDIMKSIITHIILPYQEKGYNVFISGCLYECPQYENKLASFFPKHTIKSIKRGETNQVEMYYKSIEHAEKTYPNCIEYISLRADYKMLKNIIIKKMNYYYIGFAWENQGWYPDPDLFFIISKNAINIFKNVLYDICSEGVDTCTHSILNRLRRQKIQLQLYPIWTNYKNQGVGISYNDYNNDKELHKNRPFVNYMRNLIKK